MIKNRQVQTKLADLMGFVIIELDPMRQPMALGQ
jgi:hypothetical protein